MELAVWQKVCLSDHHVIACLWVARGNSWTNNALWCEGCLSQTGLGLGLQG